MATRLTLTVLATSLAIGAACRAPSVAELVARARTYVASSRLPEAELEYQRAIQADPARGDLRLELADLYLKTGDEKLAFDETMKTADLLPNDAAVQIRAGSMLLAAHAFDDARTRANAALKLEPKNANAAILLGNALAGLSDLEGALAEYQDAIAMNPSEDAAYTNIAAIRLVHGRREEAEASFRKAIAVAPRSVSARMAYANFLWASGRLAEAEGALKDVLAIDRANESANHALGALYLTTGRAAEAEPYFRALADSVKSTASKLMLADYYLYMKRFEDARNVLAGLSTKDAQSAPTVARLAAIEAAQGRRAAALASLDEVLKKFPKDSTALLTDARLLQLDGKREQALARARTVAEDESNVPAAGDAYLEIGSLEGELGHRDQAIAAFQAALRLQPQSLPAALNLAAIQLAAGNYDDAKARAEQALAIHPGDPQARTALVRIALGRKDLATAETQIASLARDYPRSATVLDLRADLQLQAGNASGARQLFEQAAALAPEDTEASVGLIGIDLGTGHADAAIRRVESRLAAGPPTASLLMLAARSYVAAGQQAKAEDALKRAIATEPDSLEAYGLLGQLYIGEKHVDQARVQFEAILKLDPRSVSAHTMLGILSDVQGRPNDAEGEYLAALRIDPQAAVAANNLAWIYADSNRNLDQALQLVQLAHEQLPSDAQVNDTLGWVYYRRKEAAAAIKSLQASLAKNASDPATHYHLGMAYLLEGDSSEARQELARALDSKVAFAGSDEARAALSRLGR